MEAATPLRRESVRAVGDRVVIELLEVRDETFARLVREREEAGGDPVELVTDAIEIGSRVLDRESAAANTEYVRTELEKQGAQLVQLFDERARAVDELIDERLRDVFDPSSGTLAREFERAFSDESKGSVQNRVAAALEGALSAGREEMRSSFFRADETNPLHDLKQTTKSALDGNAQNLQRLGEELAAVKLQLEALRVERLGEDELEAERERGTAKGRSYEELVGELLEELARPRGDEWEPVGDETGAGGKRGDHVVRIAAASGPACGALVFESKDSKLSRPKAIEQLDGAMAQRSADYAVLVVPTDDELPAGVGVLAEFGGGDKVAVVCDPENDPDGARLSLELAYAYARARVLARRGSGDGVDVDAIAEARERAADCLAKAKTIKSQLTSTQSGIEKAKGMVEELAEGVRRELDRIAAQLEAADPGE